VFPKKPNCENDGDAQDPVFVGVDPRKPEIILPPVWRSWVQEASLELEGLRHQLVALSRSSEEWVDEVTSYSTTISTPKVSVVPRFSSFNILQDINPSQNVGPGPASYSVIPRKAAFIPGPTQAQVSSWLA
jgi:hypothetical protein